MLHELVTRYAQTMIAELRDAEGGGLPRYVERELAAYVRRAASKHRAKLRALVPATDADEHAYVRELLVGATFTSSGSRSRQPPAQNPT